MKIMKNLVLVLMASFGVASLDMHGAARARRFLHNTFHVAKPAVANSLFHWTRHTLQKDRPTRQDVLAYSNWPQESVTCVVRAPKKDTTPVATKVEESQNRPLIALSPSSDDKISKLGWSALAVAGSVFAYMVPYFSQKLWYQKNKIDSTWGLQDLLQPFYKNCPDSQIIYLGNSHGDVGWHMDINKQPENPTSLIIVVGSFGGSVFTSNWFAQEYIGKFRKKYPHAPVIAYVKSYAYSVGYQIASYADRIIVSSNAAGIGNIGTIFDNTSEVWFIPKALGISKFMYYGTHKRSKYFGQQVSSVQDCLDCFPQNGNAIQRSLQKAVCKNFIGYCESFPAEVRKKRLEAGVVLPDQKLWGEAQMFGGGAYVDKLNPETDTLQKALEYGLIDRIIESDEDEIQILKKEIEKLYEARAKKLTAAEQTIT